MAAPRVTGVAALIASSRSTITFSYGVIKERILAEAAGLSALKPYLSTGGVLNSCLSGVALGTRGETASQTPLTGQIINTQTFNAYPNPITEELNIRFEAKADGQAEWQITNLVGQTIYQEKRACAQGENNIEWRPSAGLSKGIYLLTLKVDHTLWSQKLIK